MSTYPPDGWTLGGTGVVWGTDADVNSVVTNLIGPSCIEFKNTTPANNPQWYPTAHVPVEEGKPYRVSAILQASSVSAGNTAYVGIAWYNASKTYVSTSQAHNAVLPGTGAWYEISGVLQAPSGARYARPYFSKAKNAFTVYLDYFALAEMPLCCHAYLNSAQTVSSESEEVVEFGHEVYDYGGIFDTSTYRVNIPHTGIWAISAKIGLTSMAAGSLAALALYKNGSVWITGDRRVAASAGGTTYADLGVAINCAYLSRGDYIDVRVTNADTSNRNTTSGTTLSYFMAAAVE